jgi:hypothetical protein
VRRLLVATLGTAMACLAAACSGGSTAPPTLHGSPVAVGCDQIILHTRHPFADGYRRVLGIVAVPPSYLRQVIATPGGQWPYWRKAGLEVKPGHDPVTVSVAAGWRKRAAVTWGNGEPAVASLRIAACPSARHVWHIYAGGFLLRTRSACVPLVFRVAGRTRTLRFGLDRRCRT